MQVVFRVDAATAIGTGHVVRCLTLANGLREHGLDIAFICAPRPGDLIGWLREQGMTVYPIPLGSPLQDAEDTRQVLESNGLQPGWLVVDHYRLDADWERLLRAHAKRIFVIDDIADRPHDCDLLLDQNYYEQADHRYDTWVPPHCKLLTGPQYALLRPMFTEAARELPRRTGQVQQMLISFGGSDPSGETLKTLRALQGMELPKELRIEVIAGLSNPHYETIETLCAQIPNTILHMHVTDMSTRMTAADLFVGAGGTTSWERSSLGLPGLITTIADNQVEIAENLARQGSIRYLGKTADVEVADIQGALTELMKRPETVKAMGERARLITDGQGTERVIRALIAPLH